MREVQVKLAQNLRRDREALSASDDERSSCRGDGSALPLPLAGEGRGGAASASADADRGPHPLRSGERVDLPRKRER